MPVDTRPVWQTGHWTRRELEAPLTSVRVVWAASEAAHNAGVDLAGVTRYVDQPVDWEVLVVSGQDRQRVERFLHHWHNLTGAQYRLGARDAVTGREIAGITD